MLVAGGRMGQNTKVVSLSDPGGSAASGDDDVAVLDLLFANGYEGEEGDTQHPAPSTKHRASVTNSAPPETTTPPRHNEETLLLLTDKHATATQ